MFSVKNSNSNSYDQRIEKVQVVKHLLEQKRSTDTPCENDRHRTALDKLCTDLTTSHFLEFYQSRVPTNKIVKPIEIKSGIKRFLFGVRINKVR